MVCKDWLNAADPNGYQSLGDATRMTTGAFAGVGGTLGLLAGFAIAGPFALLGPITGLIAGAAVGGATGFSVGWMFYDMQDPNEPDFVVASYDDMLHRGHALLVVHGDRELAHSAEPMLREAGAVEVRYLVKTR